MAVQRSGAGLGKRMGPLPVWGWAVVVVVGVGLALYLRNRANASAAPAAATDTGAAAPATVATPADSGGASTTSDSGYSGSDLISAFGQGQTSQQTADTAAEAFATSLFGSALDFAKTGGSTTETAGPAPGTTLSPSGAVVPSSEPGMPSYTAPSGSIAASSPYVYPSGTTKVATAGGGVNVAGIRKGGLIGPSVT